uniref:Uncharacterized protein n=1 Tax=Arabidopsis thaliana TaxID=3702 RepID=Q1PFJ8_ARATH|nr:hypothetical protein At1g56085 [Arabidopsis thaliana]
MTGMRGVLGRRFVGQVLVVMEKAKDGNRDESDNENKADKYIGRRQHHRDELREMERRNDDGIGREKKHREKRKRQ